MNTSTSAGIHYDHSFRRTHRKSRAGCGNCKTRRIKCDEEKPGCENCTRRKVRCQYLDSVETVASGMGNSWSTARSQASSLAGITPTAEESTTLTPGASTFPSPTASADVRANQPHGFDFEDYRLLHHYSIEACHGLADEPVEIDFWQVKVPHLAFGHPYVLHLLLAISSLHLGRREPPDAQQIRIKQSDHHYGAALPHVIQLLPRLHADNAEAVYIAAVLICFCHFARGPKTGDYIAFSDEGEAEWFTLLRGVRTILRDWGNVLANGVLAGGTGNTQKDQYSDAQDESSDAQHESCEKQQRTPNAVPHIRPRLAYEHQYQKLRDFVSTICAEDATFTKYSSALDTLENCFAARYQEEQSSSSSSSSSSSGNAPAIKPKGSKVVFAWLYLVPDEFVTSLQAKRPVALVIYAHYIVLMKDLEGQWLFEGWVLHILEGIEKWLVPQYRDWLQWPVQQIRS